MPHGESLEHVLYRYLRDAHSPLENLVAGGIVKWPTFEQLATEPDVLAQRAVERIDQGQKEHAYKGTRMNLKLIIQQSRIIFYGQLPATSECDGNTT